MKLWKQLVRLVLIILAVGLALLIGYGLWKVLRSYWYPIVIWGYYALAAITFLVQFWFAARLKRPDNPQGEELFLYTAIDAATEVGKFVSWRNRLGRFLTYFVSAIAWPVTFFFSYRQSRKLSQEKKSGLVPLSAYQSLYPVDVQTTVILLAVVLLVYVSHLLFVLPETFGKFLLLLATVYCTARLLFYIVSPVSLAAQLRRGPRNAYVSFLVLAVSIYCLLVLSFAGYIYTIPKVQFEQLGATTLDMLRFRKAYGLLQGGPLSPLDYYLTIAGFLYYISLLRTVLRIKEFKRKDEDYHSIAHSYLMLGNFNEGLTWLGKVTAPNNGTYMLRASAFLGVDQLTKATEAAKKSYLLEKGETLDDAGGLRQVISIAALYPIPEAYILRALERWLGLGINEIAFAESADLLLGQNKISMKNYGALLERAKVPSEAPLLWVHYLINSRNFEEASKQIEGLRLTGGVNELFIRLLRLKLRILDPATGGRNPAEVYEAWAAEHLDKMSSLISELTDDQEKVLVVFQLNFILIVADEVGSSRAEAIKYLMKELTLSIKTEDLKRQSAALSDFLRNAIQT